MFRSATQPILSDPQFGFASSLKLGPANLPKPRMVNVVDAESAGDHVNNQQQFQPAVQNANPSSITEPTHSQVLTQDEKAAEIQALQQQQTEVRAETDRVSNEAYKVKLKIQQKKALFCQLQSALAQLKRSSSHSWVSLRTKLEEKCHPPTMHSSSGATTKLVECFARLFLGQKVNSAAVSIDQWVSVIRKLFQDPPALLTRMRSCLEKKNEDEYRLLPLGDTSDLITPGSLFLLADLFDRDKTILKSKLAAGAPLCENLQRWIQAYGAIYFEQDHSESLADYLRKKERRIEDLREREDRILHKLVDLTREGAKAHSMNRNLYGSPDSSTHCPQDSMSSASTTCRGFNGTSSSYGTSTRAGGSPTIDDLGSTCPPSTISMTGRDSRSNIARGSGNQNLAHILDEDDKRVGIRRTSDSAVKASSGGTFDSRGNPVDSRGHPMRTGSASESRGVTAQGRCSPSAAQSYIHTAHTISSSNKRVPEMPSFVCGSASSHAGHSRITEPSSNINLNSSFSTTLNTTSIATNNSATRNAGAVNNTGAVANETSNGQAPMGQKLSPKQPFRTTQKSTTSWNTRRLIPSHISPDRSRFTAAQISPGAVHRRPGHAPPGPSGWRPTGSNLGSTAKPFRTSNTLSLPSNNKAIERTASDRVLGVVEQQATESRDPSTNSKAPAPAVSSQRHISPPMLPKLHPKRKLVVPRVAPRNISPVHPQKSLRSIVGPHHSAVRRYTSPDDPLNPSNLIEPIPTMVPRKPSVRSILQSGNNNNPPQRKPKMLQGEVLPMDHRFRGNNTTNLTKTTMQPMTTIKEDRVSDVGYAASIAADKAMARARNHPFVGLKSSVVNSSLVSQNNGNQNGTLLGSNVTQNNAVPGTGVLSDLTNTVAKTFNDRVGELSTSSTRDTNGSQNRNGMSNGENLSSHFTSTMTVESNGINSAMGSNASILMNGEVSESAHPTSTADGGKDSHDDIQAHILKALLEWQKNPKPVPDFEDISNTVHTTNPLDISAIDPNYEGSDDEYIPWEAVSRRQLLPFEQEGLEICIRKLHDENSEDGDAQKVPEENEWFLEPGSIFKPIPRA